MNEDLAHRPASSGQRALAFFFDYLLIVAYLLVLTAASFGLTAVAGPLPTVSPYVFDLMVFAVAVLPIILYFTLLEGGGRQATWGKRRVRIRVTAVDRKPLTYRQSLIRSLVKFVPWQIAHTSLFHIPGWPGAVEAVGTASMVGLIVAQGLALLYILCLLFTPTGRAPYDWLAGTMVVARPGNSLPTTERER
jgi:uncharacterized RDD family membrane protein YckC